MASPLKINDRWEIGEAELSWKFSRSSGPGGQSVNKTDSRAELSFSVLNATVPPYLLDRLLARLGPKLVDGVITIASSEARSQLQNRALAEKRLVAILSEAAAPPAPARRATKPSKSAKAKRLNVKKQRGEVKRLRRNTDD